MTAPVARRPDGLLFAGIALAAAAGMAAALVSQHVYRMEPCPWCVLQRAILVAIGAVALAGLVIRHGAARRLFAGLACVLALCGAAASLWQHFRAAASASCNLTLADRIVGALHLDSAMPAVFEARASCADAAVNLLGVPYDFWSLALFVAMAVATGWLLTKPTSARIC